MSAMQEPDSETLARSRRVHDLCHELAQLFTLSLEQRRAMDRLLKQLEQVTQRARAQLGQGPRPQPADARASLDYSTDTGC
jgi:hypothetical protein